MCVCVHKRSRSCNRIFPIRSLRNAVLANLLPNEASLHDTVVSLCQALGYCIPGRDRDVPSCQVADELCGPSFYLSTCDRESEEFTIYLHRELEFIICGALPPLDQYAFMACYFTTDLI